MAVFYTATARMLAEGITVSNGIIVLGETGRSRKRVDIFVDPKVPLFGGKVLVGTLVGGPAPRIVEGLPGEAAAVRIRTDACYTRNCPGSFEATKAWSVVAQGQTAWGDAGNVGRHPDVLLATREEGAVRIVFAGGRSKGYATRWLVALDRGADQPSLFLFDASPERQEPALHPKEMGWSDEERRKVLAFCLEANPPDPSKGDLIAALGDPAAGPTF